MKLNLLQPYNLNLFLHLVIRYHLREAFHLFNYQICMNKKKLVYTEKIP